MNQSRTWSVVDWLVQKILHHKNEKQRKVAHALEVAITPEVVSSPEEIAVPKDMGLDNH